LIRAWRAFLSRTPRNNPNGEEQSLLDFIVERISFSFLSLVAGLIYASVILIVLYLLKIPVPVALFLKSFMAIFALAGFLLGSGVTPIIMSSVYGLTYLWGVLLGVMGSIYPSDIDAKLFPEKSAYLWLMGLGVVSGVLFFFLQ
jgi:hypothetical protein